MNLTWFNFNSYCKILIVFFPLTVILGQSFVSVFYILCFIGSIIILTKTNFKEFYKTFKYILFFFIYLILSSLFINQINIINALILLKFFFLFIFLIYSCMKLDEKFFIKYSYYILAIFFFIFFDLIFQKIYKYDIFGFIAADSNIGRLTGPFGNKEYIPASYIYHICLPFLLLVFINNFINKKLINNLISVFICVSLVISIFMTGERIVFIMLLAALFFYFFFYKEFLLKFLVVVALCFFAIYIISSYDKYYKNRYITFINIISATKEKKISFLDSQWGAHYLTSIEIFKNNFVFGKGVRSFRIECSNTAYERIPSLSKDIRCSTHPHNFYLEILSESGFFGILFFFMVISKFFIIFAHFLKTNFFDKKNFNYKLSLAYAVPTLVLLFPIKSTGAVFSNLYGLMFWSLFAFSYGFLLKAKNTHKNLF